MKNNVFKLENYQTAEGENNSLTLEETIEKLLLKGQSHLEFDPIFKNAKGDDWDYDDGEFYVGEEGGVLMGYPVYNSNEFL